MPQPAPVETSEDEDNESEDEDNESDDMEASQTYIQGLQLKASQQYDPRPAGPYLLTPSTMIIDYGRESLS